jgi:hypothetical protein
MNCHHILTYNNKHFVQHCDCICITTNLALLYAICQSCRHTFVLRESKRTEDMGRIVWRCHAYRAGRFEPAGPDACRNGIRIGKGLPEQAFHGMEHPFFELRYLCPVVAGDHRTRRRVAALQSEGVIAAGQGNREN